MKSDEDPEFIRAKYFIRDQFIVSLLNESYRFSIIYSFVEY